MQGLVFDIQRFSIHDGPGIRTTVFLKGCNLRCFWCHNPESLLPHPEIRLFHEKCIGCGKCISVCPTHAHQMRNGNKIFIKELCQACGKCVDTCYAGALVMVGKMMSEEEVMAEVEKDRPYYESSGGGVTFSGGEPLLQSDFLEALLAESKRRKLHTAVDTAGNVPWATFERIMPYTDLFLFDVKVFDDDKHQQATGASNRRIQDNLLKLGESEAKIWIRVPVIPGVNDNLEEMDKIASFLQKLKGINLVELLPFHRLGGSKYESLGKEYLAAELSPPTKDLMDTLVALFRQKGLEAKKR